MTIGYDAIGSVSVGELGGEPDVVIFAPAASVAVTASSAPIIIGTQIFTPLAAVAAASTAPFATAGKSVAPPSASVAVVPHAPGISISANDKAPNVAIAVTALVPQIVSGNFIEANNTVTMNTTFGEIGSSSIGEFAIGEGEPATRVVKLSPLVIVMSAPPRVSAGKIARAPVASVNVTSSRAEIDSRSRKLRVFAIAS